MPTSPSSRRSGSITWIISARLARPLAVKRRESSAPVAADRRATGAEDSRLFTANGLASRAEIIHVIDPDRRDDGDVGIDDVHGVEPAAEPDFEHDCVDARLCE